MWHTWRELAEFGGCLAAMAALSMLAYMAGGG